MAVRRGFSADRRHAARRMSHQGSKVFDQRFQRCPQLVFRCPADRPVRELRLCRASEPRHCLCQSGVGQCRVPFGAPMSWRTDESGRPSPAPEALRFVCRTAPQRRPQGSMKRRESPYTAMGEFSPPAFFACVKRTFQYCSYSYWNPHTAMPLADRSPPDRSDADLARPGRVAPGTRACPVVGGGHPGRRRPSRRRAAWRGPDGDLSASRALRLLPSRTASARGDLARGGAGRYAFPPRPGGAAP